MKSIIVASIFLILCALSFKAGMYLQHVLDEAHDKRVALLCIQKQTELLVEKTKMHLKSRGRNVRRYY